MKSYSLIARVSFCAFLLHSAFALSAPAVSAPMQDDQQRAQRQAMPTYTAKGALTMHGHVERLEQRLQREAAQRSRNTVGASTQAQQPYAQEKQESVIKRSHAPITPFMVTTANILGRFDDPFEFAGDYGEENNEIREKVFDLLVSKEALAKNTPKEKLAELMAKSTITQALYIADNIKEDENHGPTLKEVVTPELLALLAEKQKNLENFTKDDLDAIHNFVTKYGNQKIFHFLRNSPPALLKLEQNLKDVASDNGKSFDLPIVGSKTILTGKTGVALKKNLANALFTDEVINQASPTFVDKKDENKIKPITVHIDNLKPDFLRNFFNNGDNKDLYPFCTPAGLVFFYWLYQALNLDLIAQATLIDEVNDVKKSFAQSLGDPDKRALAFRKKVLDRDTKVLFLQEADKQTRDISTKDALFLGTGKQNTQDGTVVLLASDFWAHHYEVIPFDQYARYKTGGLTAILARQKDTQQLFLLASGHGHSVQTEDGREQIQVVAKKLEQLIQERNEEIFLIIGTDANTKTKDDVKAFRKMLDDLGLISTQVGPTTIKRRMVTVQHGKAGLYTVDEEDYIIVKKDQLALSNVTVGFGKPGEKANVTVSLPNLHNQSDHYAVSALVQSKDVASKVVTRTEEPAIAAETNVVAQEPLKTVTTPRAAITPEPETIVAEQKPRPSALPKESVAKKPKKSVTWADETGGQLKEVREFSQEELVDTSMQKKVRRRVGG